MLSGTILTMRIQPRRAQLIRRSTLRCQGNRTMSAQPRAMLQTRNAKSQTSKLRNI